MSFTIKPATRQAVKPIIAIYGESGTGKTYSALLLARGIAGPTGKIVMVDSEAGRGSLYADVLPGGYDTLELGEPFTPRRYIEAMEAVEKFGAVVGVCDSASHEWEGIGGVLDQAAANEEKSGKAGLHNWKNPKFEHAKWVLKLLQSPIPWIVCLRAKHKSRQTKENGKTVIIKDDHTSPIQADDFIFEATAHMEILSDHTIRLTKMSHPTLGECFPNNGMIKIEHGEAIARWCNGGKPAAKTQPPSSGLRALKAELWAMTALIHKCQPGDSKEMLAKGKEWLQQSLLDEGYLSDTESLDELPEARLREVIEQYKARQQQKAA